jgi:alpha-tubulin suppressor-like RCC1 family protein
MKLFLARRRRRMVKHAVRSVVVMAAASLIFACGMGGMPVETKPTVKVSMSPAMKMFQPGQCSNATLAAGWYHTVGLKTDGTVVAVGNNINHQSEVSKCTDIQAVAAGDLHTVGLKSDGTVTAVGDNSKGQLNVSPWADIQAIAAGDLHTVGLKSDGTVVAAGDNGKGQLNVNTAEWTNIKAIAAGKEHTVGLKEDGTVVATGNNANGQLNITTWAGIKAIAAGTMHTVGLKSDGTVTAVGSNTYGQLNVSGWTGIKAIAAGNMQTLGLKDDGTVIAAGYNGKGQLNVTTWTGITADSAGVFHTVGLDKNGTVWGAGSNTYGQLNLASFTDIMPVCEASQDTTPPTTIALMTGALGSNGWYVSDVLMTLTATDNEGGSGVKEIHYIVDGTETIGSGSLASYVIVGEGKHTVTWYAIDNAGNVETPPQESYINIDKTAPAITALGTDAAILWPPNHKMVNITIGGSVAGDDGSGIASIIITVSDEYGVYNKSVSGFGSVIALEAWRNDTDMDGRVYTITAVVTDKAGNQSTGTTRVVVPHDMR